jgi:hypothetical protein
MAKICHKKKLPLCLLPNSTSCTQMLHQIVLLSHTACFLHPKFVVKYSTGGVALSSLGLYNGVSWFFTHVLKNLQFGF